MAALEDITAESKLANDFSCAELSHRQVELNIHESDLLWQSIFQLHYDSYVDSNSFNGALIFSPIKEAILYWKECNRIPLIDPLYNTLETKDDHNNVNRPA